MTLNTNSESPDSHKIQSRTNSQTAETPINTTYDTDAFSRLNFRLTECKSRMRERDRTKEHWLKLGNCLSVERKRLESFEMELRKELKDVENLEKLTLYAFYHELLGRKKEKLKKEQQEYLNAKIQYDECAFSVHALEREQRVLVERLDALIEVDMEYDSILEEAETLARSTNHDSTRTLLRLSEKIGDIEADTKELIEATEAAKDALQSLDVYHAALKEACSLAMWDAFGGGMWADFAKYGAIETAKKAGHEAQDRMKALVREIRDVNNDLSGEGLQIEIDDLTHFLDCFLDGLFDWIVASKLETTVKQCAKATDQVNVVLRDLERELPRLQQKEKALSEERRDLLEQMLTDSA